MLQRKKIGTHLFTLFFRLQWALTGKKATCIVVMTEQWQNYGCKILGLKQQLLRTSLFTVKHNVGVLFCLNLCHVNTTVQRWHRCSIMVLTLIPYYHLYLCCVALQRIPWQHHGTSLWYKNTQYFHGAYWKRNL